MAWWGTALGGVIGLAVGGPLGGLAGAVIGRGLDRGAERADLFGGPRVANPERLKERFFETTFAVMGRLAKSDGRVSEIDIAFAESVMDRMSLSPGMRRAAILFFNQGKDSEFDLEAALRALRQAGLGHGPLLQIFLEVQVAAAHVDGDPSEAQAAVLNRIRQILGVPVATFRRIERLVQIQQRILGGFAGRAGVGSGSAGGGSGGRRPGVSPLGEAYATLGVEPQASDAEVKRAYRSLMNRHHPDKLVSRGLPEEALKLASQRTQEIRRAYETINRARAA